MCGLVGIAGDTTGFRKDAFRNLLIVDQLRGMDSTGIAAIHRNSNKVELAKMPGGASVVMGTKEYKDAISTSHKVLIGHNRFATVGEHTIENAHPFDFPNIVGAHNGTLEQDDRKRLYRFAEFGTDSEAIFANIDQFGLEATVEYLGGWKSAYALTWFNKKENTINFLRNSQRPLIYAYAEDRCTLFWASEARFIQFAADHAGVRLISKDGVPEMYHPEVDMHISWEIPKTINDKFHQPIKVECKPPPAPVISAKWAGGYYLNGVWHSDHKKKDSDVGPVKVKHDHNNVYIFGQQRRDTKKWRPPYKDSRGAVINRVSFDKLISQGCCFCGVSGQNWGEFIQPFKSSGVNDYDFLCEECYNDDDVFNLCRQLI